MSAGLQSLKMVLPETRVGIVVKDAMVSTHRCLPFGTVWLLRVFHTFWWILCWGRTIVYT